MAPPVLEIPAPDSATGRATQAERASRADARSHPTTGHGMWMLDLGWSNPELQPTAGEHGPANVGIPGGCPVLQGTGHHSPHVQCPAHLPCACSHTQRTPTHRLTRAPACSAHAHIMCMLSLHTLTSRHALLGQTPPHARSHSPYMCSPSARAAPMHAHTSPILSSCAHTLPMHIQPFPLHTLPVHNHTPRAHSHTPYTHSPFAHTFCAHSHIPCRLSLCTRTHLLCMLTHHLCILPVHIHTHPVHTHATPIHAFPAHPNTPCACSCIPYTLYPWYTLMHLLYTLSPVHIDSQAHLSSLPHPHTAANPHGHPGGTRSHIPGAISPLLTAALPSLLPAQGIYLHY